MKKNTFIFLRLLILIFISGCSNESYLEEETIKTTKARTHFYGVKNIEKSTTKGVAQIDKL